jgi:hypothetical protein
VDAKNLSAKITSAFVWQINGLNCTDLCNCNTCANGLPDENDLTRNEVFDMDDDTDD